MFDGRFARLAYRASGRLTTSWVPAGGPLAAALRRAGFEVRADVYASVWLVASGLLGAAAFLGCAVAAAALGRPWLLAAGLAGGLLLAAACGVVGRAWIAFSVNSRRREMDARLAHAVVYLATMSSAGYTVARSFHALAAQSVYGQVAREAGIISRDMDLLGRDLVTALSAAMDRSPSQRFTDFLQGAITTYTTGGDLRGYFMTKSEQLVDEKREVQRGFLESLGILAESYVTVIVTAPLFVLIFLSVMVLFDTGGGDVLRAGYVIMLILVPLAQAGFATAVSGMAPED